MLNGVNIDVKRGETFAIIGATGSGKTSLVNLIPRFYDSTEGEVYIDGVEIKRYDTHALRQKIAFVMQKSELFSGTVAENLRWGKENASDEELRRAAGIAQAEDFILGFNGGYDAYIAEKGASLSGDRK